jgi:ATP-binding cassette subfamily B protein
MEHKRKAGTTVDADQGRIVEQGTHASLVAANGLCARRARLQFEGM